MSEKKKTSIKIDPRLWKKVKIEAIRRDMDVSKLVEQSLRRELKLSNDKEGVTNE